MALLKNDFFFMIDNATKLSHLALRSKLKFKFSIVRLQAMDYKQRKCGADPPIFKKVVVEPESK